MSTILVPNAPDIPGLDFRTYADDSDVPAMTRVMNAASDEGMIFMDIKGNILKRHWIGHVQNPAIADFRPDLPGLEAVSINFWGNQGIVHFFDAEGDLYHDFEPCQHGSMCLPINWTGKPGELFVRMAKEGSVISGLMDSFATAVCNTLRVVSNDPQLAAS